MIERHEQVLEYQRDTWRVIVHPPYDGAMNMAIDEAIAEHVSRGEVLPTLRFYAWNPACLTLGYTQPYADVDLERLKDSGWQVVRRLTGGRAILHTDEVTYSVSAPLNDPRVSGGVIESYRKLSRGLYIGLERLGAEIQSTMADKEARNFKGPVCFEVPTDYEITAYGRKLVGSAQTRRNDTVLQHGTIPLYGDITRICDVLYFDTEQERREARERVLARATTIEASLGERMSMVRTVGQLMAGFADALNLELEQEPLTFSELSRAEELRESKYITSEWQERF